MQKVVIALLYFRSYFFFSPPENMLQSSKNYQAFAVVDDFAILRGYSWTYIGTKSLRPLLHAIHSHLHQLILPPPP